MPEPLQKIEHSFAASQVLREGWASHLQWLQLWHSLVVNYSVGVHLIVVFARERLGTPINLSCLHLLSKAGPSRH